MVDLVKIRKKAKKARSETDASAEPVAGEARSEADTALPETVDGGRWPANEGRAGERGSDSLPNSPPEPSTTGNHPPATGNHPPATGNHPPSTRNHPPATETKLDRFKAAAGQSLRAEATVVEGVAADVAELELLTFIIAGEQYAVDIERIVEIVTPRPITRIPNADSSIVGIISLRGAIVTLVDVHRKLRHPTGATSAPDPRVVVIEQSGETVGFQVDRVVRVIKLNRAAVEPHPVVHASEQDEAIAGVFRQGTALTILLDLDKLLGARALPGPVA